MPVAFDACHRPVWAEIDLDCLAHNLAEFRRILPPQTQIMAVVKADAYGHGAFEVAKAAVRAGASRLAIACVEEGILLRRQGITAPIQILGVSAPGTESAVLEYDLLPTICTIESACRFSEAARAQGRPVRFQLKLDTGMGRIGVRPEQLAAFLDALRQLPSLEMEGVFSHFSKADEYDKTYSRRQLERYHACLQLIQAAGFTPTLRNLANSAGTMELPESHDDMVRIGISLYGFYPSDEVDRTRLHLRPVMSWKTRIAHLKTLPAGEAVSYGGTFITRRPTKVATLPLGYADGFRRRLGSQGWHVLVKGQRAPVIGRICMDMTMIDVTEIEGASSGDEVVLLGTQGIDSITADDMAARLDTIHYEITCLVGKRVPRLYRQAGTLVAIDSLLGYQQVS
ncbi:alanine racemase [candidate division KSB3 bacterium]|uniref:Alanine racemase n=1 Tax=candidate division KSB3 bacterium TaxID=2044937 RepID=A0A9D5JTE8_9BACT|nr:alanine racemase [candidate division KSB3 bacterium]MBD3323764.1 alanine racemase [candidate division KSB3 bacterium]